MTLTHGSLYSGIGGWLLAAQWAGIENIFTCEIDKFCNKVLDKHFPDTERHYDIKETNFTKYERTIDIISTSDPCQPFSFAGKRGGTTDDRYLWPQTIRVIREVKPSYVVFENVFGFISMAFETVASDLETEGYTVESFIIPACAVGAWHRRDRLWIIAHSYSEQRGANKGKSNTGANRRDNATGIRKDVSDTTKQGLQDRGGSPMEEQKGTKSESKRQSGTRSGAQNVSNTNRTRSRTSECRTDENGQEENKRREEQPQPKFSRQDKNVSDTDNNQTARQRKYGRKIYGITEPTGFNDNCEGWWATEPNVGRVAHGIPSRVDRLKSLGNSIVPQVAHIIFEGIKEYDYENRNK